MQTPTVTTSLPPSSPPLSQDQTSSEPAEARQQPDVLHSQDAAPKPTDRGTITKPLIRLSRALLNPHCEPQSPWASLWERAYEDLRIKEGDMIDAYERLLSRELRPKSAEYLSL
ncbi:hypothetical protein B0H67DRAFT_345416 [Lasiosphaeris hirsuta]|uniref:Uncharacterized protein n=1 Tax=Lasiosphaeris hirsuta TaxID=260670 RepID=A0AA40A3I9_9PEZI|nr:hypothetical protein B0H67DRAFT_345416 [Lasiosphaeris hirsuta]